MHEPRCQNIFPVLRQKKKRVRTRGARTRARAIIYFVYVLKSRTYMVLKSRTFTLNGFKPHFYVQCTALSRSAAF